MRIVGLVVAAVAVAGGAAAHHILGIPHYAYDEQYPQTPVLTYRVDAGDHEVRMTGYPGVPTPGERCSLHVYIVERETQAPFTGLVTLRVLRDRMLGDDPVVYGPITVEREEGVFKFFPEFAHESNYLVRIDFEIGDVPWTIDLPMVVGEPGSPWLVLGGAAVALTLFLLVIRALRIKQRRRDAQGRMATAAGVVRG